MSFSLLPSALACSCSALCYHVCWLVSVDHHHQHQQVAAHCMGGGMTTSIKDALCCAQHQRRGGSLGVQVLAKNSYRQFPCLPGCLIFQNCSKQSWQETANHHHSQFSYWLAAGLVLLGTYLHLDHAYCKLPVHSTWTT